MALEEAGAFAVVLEMVPRDVAARVTEELDDPDDRHRRGRATATPRCWSGRTWPGCARGRLPKFVKRYADLRGVLAKAAREFGREVAEGAYPEPGQLVTADSRPPPRRAGYALLRGWPGRVRATLCLGSRPRADGAGRARVRSFDHLPWTGRSPEPVDADELHREGPWWVLERWALVIGLPTPGGRDAGARRGRRRGVPAVVANGPRRHVAMTGAACEAGQSSASHSASAASQAAVRAAAISGALGRLLAGRVRAEAAGVRPALVVGLDLVRVEVPVPRPALGGPLRCPYTAPVMSAVNVALPGRVSAAAATFPPGYLARSTSTGPRPAPFTGPEVKDAETIEAMRVAGRIAAERPGGRGRAIAPGVTTDELDRVGHEFLVDHGAYPSTLGYPGRSRSRCAPRSTRSSATASPTPTGSQDGDIVNIDITAFIGGVHGDTNATFLRRRRRRGVRLLVERTHEAMMRGIRAAAARPAGQRHRPGHRVVRAPVRLRRRARLHRPRHRHGVPQRAWSSPTTTPRPHYDTVIEPGMTFTVEPMLNLGTPEWEMWDDGWTVVTDDRRRTAQFEHTILVTEDGPEILTRPTAAALRVSGATATWHRGSARAVRSG